MYPPNQPKVPPVRPRSSLSTDEHHRFKDSQLRRRNPSNAVLTLAGFCIFLFVLCVFLLGALVYVGRTIADEATAASMNLTLTAASIYAEGDIAGSGRYLPSSTSSSSSPAYHPQAVDSPSAPPSVIAVNNNLRSNAKPIVIFRSNQYQLVTTERPAETTFLKATTYSDEDMATSRILNQLSFHLPPEIRPKHYRLQLHPDLKAKTFAGNVIIQLEVLKPIAFIPVHSRKLNVSTDEVFRITKEGEKLANMTPSLTFAHPDLEYWVTEFDKALETGEYAIRFSFNGSLANSTSGFYQSSYLDKQSNDTRWIATSKFEPTFARQAFPCFDEPSMKASFQITLVRPTDGGYHALSNMNQESENVVGENTEVTFAETVPMSTYLACFIVSDFVYKSKNVKGGANATDFEMRVFATDAQLNKVSYALDTGVGITEFYINYFGIPYPLPKLDMAAIPDFVSGAMEHWGLVTYRETALLYDKETSSSSNKQRVATVVAHELAHMWFGNLVTMKWWNDLWLNEGFASYIEYKGINHMHPEWKMLDQFIIDDLHGVMRIDATLASHPIVQTVENPNQITELFDSITYSKGASIIRMLEDVIGSEHFKNATHSYLMKHKFGNAETDDFLSEIEAIGFDFEVKNMMKTWTEQMGLPVVEVTKMSDNQYKLTQKRFFSNPENYDAIYDDSHFNYRWSIPITFFTSDNPDVQRSWFNHDDSEHVITLPSSVEWLKINKDQMGYYLVNYPEDTWKAITDALIKTVSSFSVTDRAHLISDAFTLAAASQLTFDVALNLTTYLENEFEHVPWSVATSKLFGIKNHLYYTELYSDFNKYARKLLNKAVENVKWDVDDNHLRNLLRVDILSAALSFGHVKSLEEAASRFKIWISKPEERPNPDVRQIVYYYGMLTAGNEDNWELMWKLLLAETDASEKIKLMKGLAGIKEPWILQRYIDLAWNETYVRRQDYFTCLQYISRNPIGENLVWNYVRENWTKLVDRFGINERYLGRIIPAITARFSTHQKLEEMEYFFQKYPEAGAGTAARKEAIENVKYNIKWLELNRDKVGSWLKKP